MPIEEREIVVITNDGIEFKASASQYPTVESFRQALVNKQVNYDLLTPISSEHSNTIIYQVSDFGTEQVDYSGSVPNEKILYQHNLRDKLQKLPNVTELNTQIANAVAPKLDITTAEQKYAAKTGYYESLHAGLADNIKATIGTTDTNTTVFRSAGGSADISDGYAEVTSVRGNSTSISSGFINSFITGIKTIGFNQWNGEYIHVLPSTTFNHYCIKGTRTNVIWYASLADLRSGTGGTTLTIQTGTNTSGVTYNYFVVATEGYVKVVGASSDTCVSFVWSGYRVEDFEQYWTSTLPISVNNIFPSGMRKAGSVYDELTSSKAITRIGLASFDGLETITTEADTDPLYVKYVVAKEITGIATGNNNLSTIPLINSISATATQIKFRVLLTNYANVEAFRTVFINSSLEYELANPITTPLEYNLNYKVSDFGTEEVLFTNLAPSVEVIFYQMNLRDKLQRLPGASELETSLNSKLNISTAESDYAKQRGSYPFLNSGTADNLNATIGTIDDAVWTLRTTGGTTSVTDGFANIISVNGVANGTNIKSLRTIGFNAFDKTKGYAFVLGGNEYCVNGTYTALGFTTTIGGTLTTITTTTATTSSGVEYQSYTPTENGYIYVTNPSLYMCISLVWSGYRVTDYENYWEDNLNINSINYFPNGMYKAKYIYDELNSEKAIKRVSSYTFTGSETLTQSGTTKEVPSDYTQLEYIEATGTQWLDTGFNPASGIGVYRFECKYASTSTASGWHVMVGCNNPSVYFGFNGTSMRGSNFTLTYPDGTPVAGDNTAYRIIATATGTGSYTFALFGQKNGSTTATNLGIGRMYECSIYQLNTTTNNWDLLKRFIPAKRVSDDVLGMYETVGQTFIVNSGTGDFTASSNTVHFYNTYSITNSDFDVKTNTYNMVGQSTQFNYGQVDTADTPSGYTRLESINFNQWNSTIGYGNGFTFPYSITQVRKVILDMDADSTTNSMIMAAATSRTTTDTASPYINMTGQSGHSNLTRTVSTVAGFYSRVQAQFTWTTSSSYYLVFGHWGADSGWRFAGHLYGVKLYSDTAGTTLLADYIPVMRNSDNKVGLYDKISGEFLTNPANKDLGYTLKTLANGNNIYGNLTNLYIQAYDVDYPTTSSILSELSNKYIRWEKSQPEEQTSATELRYRISDFGLEELILETGASTPDTVLLYQVNLRDNVQQSLPLLKEYINKKNTAGNYTIDIDAESAVTFKPAPAFASYSRNAPALGGIVLGGTQYRLVPQGGSYEAQRNENILTIGNSYISSWNADEVIIGYGSGVDTWNMYNVLVGHNIRGGKSVVDWRPRTVAVGNNIVATAFNNIAIGNSTINCIDDTMGIDSADVNRTLHLYDTTKIFFRDENISSSKTALASITGGYSLGERLNGLEYITTSLSGNYELDYNKKLHLTAQADDLVITFRTAPTSTGTNLTTGPEYCILATTTASCIISFPSGVTFKTNDTASVIINQNIISLNSGKTFEISIQDNLGLIYVW